jgi:hypothetical protein
MAHPGTVNVTLTTREAKAAASALEDASKAAPKGSRFRGWAAAIAVKIKVSMKAPATTGPQIFRDVWVILDTDGKPVAMSIHDWRRTVGREFVALQGEFRAYAKQPDLAVAAPPAGGKR